jgi:tRNA nucleotidyltransferase (CCA-adding enzyme)
MTPIRIPHSLRPVLDAIRRAGGRPLVVGGAVRDAAFGLEPKDFDVEVYGLPAEPLRAALGEVGRVNAVGASFGVLKVAVAGVEIDVALPRRESKSGRGHRGFLVEPDATMTPEQAASRRDFTINAMAYDPQSGDILDFFGGLDDLRARILRHVSPAFADDPLRVLRGVQLAGRFGLSADPRTLDLSRRLFPEHAELALERVWAEWCKWAAKSVEPAAGLRYLRDCGWRAAYPEVQALEGCPQDPEWHPEGDAWVHTLLAADCAARVAARDGLAEGDRAVLVLAALCHDLGKPATTVTREGRVRSPDHSDREETYRGFLGRIGCPERIADRVAALSRCHLSHLDYVGSARHVRRLARTLGEGGETIEMLARLVEADHDARPPLPGGMPEGMAALLEQARELAASESAPRPLLLGRHLIEMGVEPGPRMGSILREAYEAQLDGAFRTVEEAREWAGNRLSR